jgi:hypothetical protein
MPQFNHLALPRTQLIKPVQSLVESHKFRILVECNSGVLFRFAHYWDIRATLCSLTPLRVIDKDVPHDAGCYTHKVSTIPPISRPIAHQPDIGFVYERGRLQGMPGPLRPEV